MKKIIFVILLALIATATVQAGNKRLKKERAEFIRYADTAVLAVTDMVELYDKFVAYEDDPLDRFLIETVGTDAFWAATTPPATREAVAEMVRRYSESFSEVEESKLRGETIARPDIGDNWLAYTDLSVYGSSDFPRTVDAGAGTIRVAYTDPGTVAVLTLDDANPEAMLDSIAFRIEREGDELLRLVMENTAQNGRGISRRRFIEAVAVVPDGRKSSFPSREYRHSQLGKMVGELKAILAEWEEARRQAVGADAAQLKQLRAKFNSDYKVDALSGQIGSEHDRIIREYVGKVDRIEIYYRTEPVQKELILTKKFIQEDIDLWQK